MACKQCTQAYRNGECGDEKVERGRDAGRRPLVAAPDEVAVAAETEVAMEEHGDEHPGRDAEWPRGLRGQPRRRSGPPLQDARQQLLDHQRGHGERGARDGEAVAGGEGRHDGGPGRRRDRDDHAADVEEQRVPPHLLEQPLLRNNRKRGQQGNR